MTRIDNIRAALNLLPSKSRDLPPELEWQAQAIAKLNTAANTLPDVTRLATTAPDKLDALLDQYARDKARQETAAWLLKSGAHATLKSAYEQHLDDYLPTLLEKLAPIADQAATKLALAAQKLPAGAAALDAPAVLASGAGDAYAAASEAINTLEILAALHAPKVDPKLAPTRAGHGVAAIVGLPAGITPTRMGTYARRPVDPAQAAQNATIAALPDSWRDSHAHTLLAVARGEQPGVTIDLAPSRAVADARATTLVLAGQTTAVDDRPDAATRDRQATHRQATRKGILAAGYVNADA